MEINLLKSMGDIQGIRDEWTRLAAEDGTVFQKPEFAIGWMSSAGFAIGAKIAVVTAHHEGQLVGLLPGCTSRRAGVRMLHWLGGGATDYGGMLYRDCTLPRHHVAAALLDGAARAPANMLYLPNIRHDNPDFEVYRSRLRPYFEEVAPYLEPGDLADPSLVKALEKGERARQDRKMRREGTVEQFDVDAEDPRLPELFTRFIELKRDRLAELGEKSPLSEGAQADFYLQQIHDNSAARFSVLTFDGSLAAAHFGYETADRFYYLLPAFDREFGRYSPSVLLLRTLIKRSLEAGRVFDFSIGAEAYKNEWTQREARLTGFVGRDVVSRGFLAGKRAQSWIAERRDR